MKTSSPQQPQESGNGGSVASWLTQTRLGTPQTFRDIVVWPLFLPAEPGQAYRTLDEAVKLGTALVSAYPLHARLLALLAEGTPLPAMDMDGALSTGASQDLFDFQQVNHRRRAGGTPPALRGTHPRARPPRPRP